LGIGEAQKEAMRKMPNRDKWMLIQQKKATPKFDTQTPEFYIQKMKESSLSLKQLEELRILLGTAHHTTTGYTRRRSSS
jgi:hypothetical protein